MDEDAEDVNYATTTPCDELGCQRDGVQEGRKATHWGGAHRNAGGHKGRNSYKTRLTMDDNDKDVDNTTTHAHRSTPRPTSVRGDSRGISRWTNAVDENKTRVLVGQYPGRPPSYGLGRVPKKHRRLQAGMPTWARLTIDVDDKDVDNATAVHHIIDNDSCDVKGTTAAGMAQQRL
jgi:hypothetical protein